MPDPDTHRNYRSPNFHGYDGNLYLVRCFVCGLEPRGRENLATAVSSGTCAWCGWPDVREDALELLRSELTHLPGEAPDDGPLQP